MYFFSGECKAAKPHCRAMVIKTNKAAIEIAVLATISSALLSAKLSHLCCKWDKLSNRQMAQNQNYSFVFDKLFAYVGIRSYARSSLTVVLNNLLLFIKGCARLHSTLVRKHFHVLFSRTNMNISYSLSFDPEKGFTYKEAHCISEALWLINRWIQTYWIALTLSTCEVFHSLWLMVSRFSDNLFPCCFQLRFVYNLKMF